ncbi:AraC family transcriptional regulator [Paenibacillus lycopersici]|uniref:AraC family transcriptional regulator n=1 Tax=Paenibacillus lycopersici TaxID=2704462 RepID=A0A6C0FR99_9BACL|nr:AraC family transcriptional regulator [Paenibacillus lycopersici]QHT59397.1 AraC family transcriptional regulator [Paenibacillus lycopersici]
MYRLMIADDEALEREGLEWIVQRMLPDTFEIVQAENGRRAIELAEERRPQIVLMDVQMPGIQGLEALREIRKLLPDAKFVLVTAYDSFHYAQAALALGVKEYIVKPAGREQVASLLRRLAQELDQEKASRAEQLTLRSKVSTLQPLVENELALILMMDQAMDSSPEQLAEWLDFPLEDCRCLVAAFPGSESADERRSLYESIRHTAKSFGPCLVSSIVEHHLAVFLRKPLQTADEWKEEPVRLARKLADAARSVIKKDVSIGIGSLRSGADGMRQSYFEAVFASTCPDAVCVFDGLQRSGLSPAPGRDGADREGWQSYVMSALQRIRDMREEQTLTIVDRAKQYIRQHFARELSLEEVAESVHLNQFYFSKVFKQHVGETFIDYLTGLRIERAKQLIEEDVLSLKEVSYQVGYKDPNYFSRVFKKVTGAAPSEYRSRRK